MKFHLSICSACDEGCCHRFAIEMMAAEWLPSFMATIDIFIQLLLQRSVFKLLYSFLLSVYSLPDSPQPLITGKTELCGTMKLDSALPAVTAECLLPFGGPSKASRIIWKECNLLECHVQLEYAQLSNWWGSGWACD